MMRTQVTLLAAMVVLAALGGSQAARADEKPDVRGVWVYDVRVVRVDPPTSETAEGPSPFPELTGTTIELAWGEVLGRLKTRGATTILLDQRLTGLPGTKGVLTSERATPIVALNSEDVNNKQYRAITIRTGVKFEQTTTADQLQCVLEVRGMSAPPADHHAPAQTTLQWNATHTPLLGDTLVFRHREQVAEMRGAPPRAVEHYGFVTGRFVRSRVGAHARPRAR